MNQHENSKWLSLDVCCQIDGIIEWSLATATHQCHTIILQRNPMRCQISWDPFWTDFWENHQLLNNADSTPRNPHVSGSFNAQRGRGDRWDTSWLKDSVSSSCIAENVLDVTCWTIIFCQSLWRNNVPSTFKSSPPWHCSWNNLLAPNTSPMMHFYTQEVTLVGASRTAGLMIQAEKCNRFRWKLEFKVIFFFYV